MIKYASARYLEIYQLPTVEAMGLTLTPDQWLVVRLTTKSAAALSKSSLPPLWLCKLQEPEAVVLVAESAIQDRQLEYLEL
jgi:hypothetical protein